MYSCIYVLKTGESTDSKSFCSSNRENPDDKDTNKTRTKRKIDTNIFIAETFSVIV